MVTGLPSAVLRSTLNAFTLLKSKEKDDDRAASSIDFLKFSSCFVLVEEPRNIVELLTQDRQCGDSFQPV